mmetsp:Transcript_8715/g.14785  ORF Transcript_8715/g.14785 Transcript_8715/m.14785 type:complete len:159 (+) Transcript_8715:59-535(+)
MKVEMVEEEDLKGVVLNQRYLVQNYIDKGAYGQVLEIFDTENPSVPLVIKVITQFKSFSRELSTMKALQDEDKKRQKSDRMKKKIGLMPTVEHHGVVLCHDPEVQAKNKVSSKRSVNSLIQTGGKGFFLEDLEKLGSSRYFIIMPRYGKNLSQYFISN